LVITTVKYLTFNSNISGYNIYISKRFIYNEIKIGNKNIGGGLLMYQHEENLTMSRAFARSVERHGDRVAQRFNPDLYYGNNGGQFTWNEMQQRVEDIACGLLSLGLEKGERVAIMAPNSPYWTHSDIAVINCGAVLVTIYPTLSLNEVSYIVNDSECRYLIVGNEDILNRVLPGREVMPTLEKIIILDLQYKTDDPGIMNLTQLMELGRQNRASKYPLYQERWQNISLDDWATILYTWSTSTAVAKRLSIL
jgi:long-chain acyl-CoA synthetase